MEHNTKKQLIEEIESLRRQVAELEQEKPERKRAEEALLESERRTKAMLESIGDHISMMDKDLNIIWANDVAKRIFGDDIVGKKCYAAYHRRTKPCEPYPCLTLRAFQDGKVHEHDTQVIGKDGKIVDFHCTANVALWDRDGKPAAVIEISRDITEHKRAEEALIRLSNAVRMSTDSIVISDLEGNIIEANEATLKMYGTEDKGDVIGKNSFDLIAPEDREKAFAGMEEAVEKGYTQSREYHIITKDGSRLLVEMNSAIMRAPDGKPIGFVGVSRDITERKKAEEALQESYKQETKLRQELEKEMNKRVEFTRMLVHELKTPLTPVLASSEMLVDELQHKPDSPILRLARNIYQGASNLNKRVDELLDLARGELNMLQLEPTAMDPLQLLHGVINEIAPMISNWRQSLIVDLPSSLPLVLADESRLRQVVLNLLTNASKFTPQGGRITLRAGERGANLVVECQDTGSGIAKEEQERLFNAYYRVKGDSERLSGLGLGLALCKKLVELHGGRTWVESEEGKGSTFGFSLPLEVADRQTRS